MRRLWKFIWERLLGNRPKGLQKCIRCRKPIEFFTNTGRARGKAVCFDLHVNSTREVFEGAVCSSCMVPVGRALAGLIGVLEGGR